MRGFHCAPRAAVRARKRVLRWGFLAQPAQRMHPADARSSAARRVVVLPAQVTSWHRASRTTRQWSRQCRRWCMLASIAAQAVSGAASTCALPDSCVDIFSPMRCRFSSATGKSDVTEDDCRWLGGSPLRLSAQTHGCAHQRAARSTGGVGRSSCLSPFYGGVCDR